MLRLWAIIQTRGLAKAEAEFTLAETLFPTFYLHLFSSKLDGILLKDRISSFLFYFHLLSQ